MTTFYVDRWIGKDGNPGTEAAPWATFSKAADYIAGSSFAEGDRFLLAWGCRFEESITIHRGGVTGRPLTISAYIPNADRKKYGPPVITGKCRVERWRHYGADVWQTVIPFRAGFDRIAQVYFGNIAGIPRSSRAALAGDLEWFFDSATNILYIYSHGIPIDHYGEPTGVIYYVPGTASGTDVLVPDLIGITKTTYNLDNILISNLILEGFAGNGIYVEAGKTVPLGTIDSLPAYKEWNNFPGVEVRDCLFRDPVFYDKAHDLTNRTPEPVRGISAKDAYVYSHNNTFQNIPGPIYGDGKGTILTDSDFFAGAKTALETNYFGGAEIWIYAARGRYLGCQSGGSGAIYNEEENLQKVPPAFLQRQRISGNTGFVFIIDDPFLVPGDYTKEGLTVVEPEVYLPEVLDQFQGRGCIKGPGLAVVGSRMAESPNCWDGAKGFLRDWDANDHDILNHSWTHTAISSVSGFWAFSLQATGGYTSTATAEITAGGHLVTKLDGVTDQDYDLSGKRIYELVEYLNNLANYSCTGAYQGSTSPESEGYARASNLAIVSAVSITSLQAFAWNPDAFASDEISRNYDFLAKSLGVRVQRLYVMPYGSLYECSSPESKINTLNGGAIGSRDAVEQYYNHLFDYQRQDMFRLGTFGVPPSTPTPDLHNAMEEARDYVVRCQLRGVPAIFFCHPATTPEHIGAALDGALKVADHWGIEQMMSWLESLRSAPYLPWHRVSDFSLPLDLTPLQGSRCVGEGRPDSVGTDLYFTGYPLGDKTDIGAIKGRRGYV